MPCFSGDKNRNTADMVTLTTKIVTAVDVSRISLKYVSSKLNNVACSFRNVEVEVHFGFIKYLHADQQRAQRATHVYAVR